MPVQIEAVIVPGFKLVAHNSCMSMGQYYPEDDWPITVLAEDMDQLEHKYVEKIFNSGIVVGNVDIWPANLLKVPVASTSKLFVWTKGTKLSLQDVCAFRNRVETSEEYKTKQREKQEKEKKIKDAAQEKTEQLQRQNDLKQYHHLKKQFESEWDDWEWDDWEGC